MKEEVPQSFRIRGFQPYFDLHHRGEAWLADMPAEVLPNIKQLLKSGEVQGQYVMPFERPAGDMRLSMPRRLSELYTTRSKPYER